MGLASRLNKLEAEFREKIEEIKAQTSRSSEDQEEKIAIIRARERNLAQLLNQTREEMVGLKTQNRVQSKRIDQLEQKLAKLHNTSPSSSALITDNIKAKMKNRAYSTPPSSCQELSILDHNLDGIYLVKNKETKKIQTVFCKFSVDNKGRKLFIFIPSIKIVCKIRWKRCITNLKGKLLNHTGDRCIYSFFI